MVSFGTAACMRRYASIKSVLIGLVMTFFTFFDVPVFWPILLMYWCILFVVTMKRQIKHMIKYRYIPFSWGKKVGLESCCIRDFAFRSAVWFTVLCPAQVGVLLFSPCLLHRQPLADSCSPLLILLCLDVCKLQTYKGKSDKSSHKDSK